MQEDLYQKIHMPLVEAMLKYKEENIYPFHTPGHKGGRGMEQLLRQELGSSVAMDVSLMSELDDIHEPQSYIAQAQKMASVTYGSDACFWAVNGTTEAVQAMIMSTLNPGEKILLPRNAHRSVAGGLILGGIEATFIEPEFCEDFGIYTQLTPDAVETALKMDKNIKAVLITSPNYYGIAAKSAEISAICHKYGVPLLIDEAHGAHLGFSTLLPPSALQCGADACAQSTHKILGAMTQCSMLHIKSKLLDIQKVADIMSVLTTTSPNYLLMASLDAARAQVQCYGKDMTENAVAAAQKLRDLCLEFEGLKVLQEQHLHGLQLDITKVTVNFSAWGYSGVEVGDALRKAGIAVELVDAENVLFLVTYADTTDDYDLALNKIRKVLQRLAAYKKMKLTSSKPPAMPSAKMVASLREVFFSSKKAVPFLESIGMICAEQVSFYPPGIPVLLPGEIITEEIIRYCIEMKQLGLPVSGPADSNLASIRVVN